jgi:hypothetical protein
VFDTKEQRVLILDDIDIGQLIEADLVNGNRVIISR